MVYTGAMESSNEFFYLDDSGKKADASLHADLLKQPASEYSKRQERERLKQQGISEEAMRKTWPGLFT